jgi:hypothetical protein
MRREDNLLFAVLAAGCLVLPIAAGYAFAVPMWLVVLLVLVTLTTTFVAYRRMRFRRQQALLRAEEAQRRPPDPPPAPPEEPADAGMRMADVTLPSAEPGYRFMFSATVFWRPAPNPVGMRHTNPEALAMESVRSRASRITEANAPGDHLAVGYEVASALGTVLPDATGQVVTWATDVSLSISDEDAARLRKITDLRKHEQVWEHERGFERNMRGYIKDEVLDSPGSAVVWWLARHLDDVEGTVRLIGPLAQLSAVAHDTPVRELLGDLVPRQEPPRQVGQPATPALDAGPHGTEHVLELANQLFTESGDDAQRRLFAYELANLLDNHGHPELAGRVRNVFGVPPLNRSDNGEGARRLDR